MMLDLETIIGSYDASARLDRASTIPSAWYTDERVFELERQTVFSRSWQFAARADQLRAPRDFVTTEIAGEPIVIVRGNEMVVSFTHCDGGLTAKGGAVKGFVIAGADRQWKPAQARIEGETVIVSSPAVGSPIAVRYAWANFPTASLFNAAGLPATPFRGELP